MKWFSDSQNCCSIVNVGSPKPHLQSIAAKNFNLCMLHDIELEIAWLPRMDNEKADYLSRIIDYDDWSLDHKLFKFLDNKWGPHTVDRFACFCNAQLSRYNSRFWNPGSEAVDAFTQRWSAENNWLCPPVSLIVRTVKHLVYCKESGTLVVPEWPSSFFWPYINPTTGVMRHLIVDWCVLPNCTRAFHSGRARKYCESAFSGTPSFRTQALRLVA